MSDQEAQKQLARKMVAFAQLMKKYEEEVAQPDEGLLEPKVWESLSLAPDKVNRALAALTRFEALPPKEKQTIIETVGDGLDDTFYSEDDLDSGSAKDQAMFLVNLVSQIMQQGVAEEIISAPVDVEGIQALAQIAAEEREDRKARKKAKP